MDLAREVHIARATYTGAHPDDLLRDLCREAALLPALVAETTVRPPEDARDVLIDALAGLRRVETIIELILELGHLKADQLDDVTEAALTFNQSVEAMLADLDAPAAAAE